MARNGGRRSAGTPSCPWTLRAAGYQRITLSIIEFTPPREPASAPTGSTSDVMSCVVVVERTGSENQQSGSGNRTSESMFCGSGRRRENLVYTSTSNVVDVYLANMTSSREFLVKYEGI